jgi:hypothetical protein
MARHLPFTNGDKRRRPYWRDQRLLGKSFLDKQSESVLIIGKDSWSRQEVVDNLHIGNFAAAQNLSKIANKLNVDSLEQLTSRFTMEDLFAERGFGVVTMVVLMAAQEAKNKDPMKWLDKKPADIVTLSTEKHRILKQQHDATAASKKAARAAHRKAG